MKKGEKYIYKKDFSMLEYSHKAPSGSHVFTCMAMRIIATENELNDLIPYPTSKEHLAELLNMQKEGEGYLDNGTYLSVFELEMLYNTIVLSKVELFNKIRRR